MLDLAGLSPEHLLRLSPQEFAELEKLIDRQVREQEERKFYRLYPETGPLRRELYAKHMEFFAGGAEHQERAFIAANRCITPWTVLETGYGSRLVGECLAETSLDVRVWDSGPRRIAQASGVFLKGIEPAFRVHLDNGEAFDCSRKHRVLTDEGWLSLGQLVSRASGWHWYHRPSDYRASCGEGDRRCGPQPQAPLGIGREQPPSPSDVQRPFHEACVRGGVEEHKQAHSHIYPDGGLPSIQGDRQRLVDLCGRFADPSVLLDAVLSPMKRQEFVRWSRECGRPRSEAPIHQPLQSAVSPACDCLADYAEQDTTGAPLAWSRPGTQSQEWKGPTLGIPEFWHADCGEAIFVALSGPVLVGGARIQTIVPLGMQPILDLTVPYYHQYMSAGAVHHNSGKSLCVCYEDVCHLTGEYPDWWVGRRFDRPITTWVAGEDTKAVRESLQPTLLGITGAHGTGLIPGKLLINATPRSGVPEAVDAFTVRHISGGVSRGVFKTYDQGRESFQASKVDVVVFDEEPPVAIYSEGLTRTMSTVPGQKSGLVMCAFTPLKGLSGMVLSYMPGGERKEGAL